MKKSLKILSVLFIFILLIYSFPNKVLATINFSISNPVLNDYDEVEVDATISGLISSSCSVTGCYLQAQLQSAGGYFGYTYNNSGEYVEYFRTPSSIDEIKTKLYNFVPVAGSWNGKLRLKNNSFSSNYYGPGDYLLNFRRFSGNSLSATSGDSNSIAIALKLPLITPTPEIGPSPTPDATSTPFVLRTPDPSPVVTASPAPKILPTSTPQKQTLSNDSKNASSSSMTAVLAAADETLVLQSPTSEFSEKSDTKFPIFPIILITLGICFIGISIFSIIRNEKKNSEIS